MVNDWLRHGESRPGTSHATRGAECCGHERLLTIPGLQSCQLTGVRMPPDPSQHSTRAQNSSTPEPSTLGEDLTITGSVTSKGEIHIDGHVQGVFHRASLVLAERSSLKAYFGRSQFPRNSWRKYCGAEVGPLPKFAASVDRRATAVPIGICRHDTLPFLGVGPPLVFSKA